MAPDRPGRRARRRAGGQCGGRRADGRPRCGLTLGALDNRCRHQGGPLGEGSIENGLLHVAARWAIWRRRRRAGSRTLRSAGAGKVPATRPSARSLLLDHREQVLSRLGQLQADLAVVDLKIEMYAGSGRMEDLSSGALSRQPSVT